MNNLKKLIPNPSSTFMGVKKWWVNPPKTFDKAFNRKNNSIGFLRLVLASLVIITHAYPLGGNYGKEIFLRITEDQGTLGGFAVKGFFILSGFLIAASYMHLNSLGRFLWHRLLRIMPAFWVCLFVTAFLFAPIFFYSQNGTLSGYQLFTMDGPIAYLRNNLFLVMNQYEISSLTQGIPWKGAFNGSLWTLIYEFGCYLLVAILGLFGILNSKKTLVLGLTVFIYICYLTYLINPTGFGVIAGGLNDVHLLGLTLVFLVGSCWYLYRDKILIDNKLFLLSVASIILSMRLGLYNVVLPLALAYCIFYWAAKLPFKSIDRNADFSYGIYIYAFPVQQLMSLFGYNKLNIIFYCILAFGLTLPFAVASYYLVERPALMLKDSKFW